MKNNQDLKEDKVNSEIEPGKKPRIAFLVVYVFDENTRPLFDIHLEKLRCHTSVEFRIFAAAHKLTPEHQNYVLANPEIELVDCEVPSGYHVRLEHSHCLNTLAKYAMSKNFTHCMSLHLDSFPVKDRWLEILVERLNCGAKLAVVVPNGYSAGLLFTRQYFEKYKPNMLISDGERETETFKKFIKTFPHFDHVETGLGYIYRAWCEGLPWLQIETDENRKIYGGLLFHMVGATFRTWVDVTPLRKERIYVVTWQLISPLVRRLPMRSRHTVRNLFVDHHKISRDGSVLTKKEEIATLISDPDFYLASHLANFRGPLLAEIHKSRPPYSS
ncbi:MAG TPA: hypothetical protein DCF68_06580 [Cyanothece sp. UBA12306]|nr:hypothetical protein [Cyanothece sp. UBA12306]